MKTKRCSKCKKSKALDKFYKRSASSDGYGYWCRDCCRVWQKEYHRICNDDLAFVLRRRAKALENHNKHHKILIGYLRHIFHKINSRCTNPKIDGYEYFGDLGIKCLFKDTGDFINHIINDLGIKSIDQIKELLLDRIDKAGDFEPGNVQFVTASQCAHSHRKQRTSSIGRCSSRFKGVSFRKDRKKYRAYIKHNGKYVHLGHFASDIEAAKVYDRKAIELWGADAMTNEMLGLL